MNFILNNKRLYSSRTIVHRKKVKKKRITQQCFSSFNFEAHSSVFIYRTEYPSQLNPVELNHRLSRILQQRPSFFLLSISSFFHCSTQQPTSTLALSSPSLQIPTLPHSHSSLSHTHSNQTPPLPPPPKTPLTKHHHFPHSPISPSLTSKTRNAPSLVSSNQIQNHGGFTFPTIVGKVLLFPFPP